MALTKVTSGLISADASSVDLNIDAGTLYIDSTNNRVGVSNTSPSATLDVSGTAVVNQLNINSASYDNRQLGMDSNGFFIYNSADASYDMVISDTGNVGISTTSPTEKLTVNGALAITGALVDDRTSTGAIDFSGGITRFVSYGASGVGGIFAFRTASGGASSTERMRITGSSDKNDLVGIATTSPQATLHVSGEGTHQNTLDTQFLVTKDSNSDWSARIKHTNAADYGLQIDGGSGDYAIYINDNNGTPRFRVNYSGTIFSTSTSINSISDERLKENITNANSQWNEIKALRFVNFDWTIDSGLNDGKRRLGLIAQEVEVISPELIEIDAQSKEDIENEVPDPEYKGINYALLNVKAVKALQEAMTRIEDLEARIATLENA